MSALWRVQPLSELRYSDFPGGPVVKTPRVQCRERRFCPWSGNLRSTCHVAPPPPKKRKGTKNHGSGNSLVVQWLGFRASTARGPGSIPSWGTKILQATWHGQETNKQTNHGTDPELGVGDEISRMTQLEARGQGSLDDAVHTGREGWRWTWRGKWKMSSTLWIPVHPGLCLIYQHIPNPGSGG